jgi:hypothetical protein
VAQPGSRDQQGRALPRGLGRQLWSPNRRRGSADMGSGAGRPQASGHVAMPASRLFSISASCPRISQPMPRCS